MGKNYIDIFKDLTGLGALSRWLKAWVVRQPRAFKRPIIMAFDLAVLMAVMATLIYFRMSLAPGYEAPTLASLALLFLLPFLSVLAFHALGLYRLVTRHIGKEGGWRIAYGLLAAIAIWSLLIFLADLRGSMLIAPRTVVAGFFLLGWPAIWLDRELIRWWLRDKPLVKPSLENGKAKKVLIYGAGETGLNLLRALEDNQKFSVVGFLDDDPSLWGMKFHGQKVHAFEKLDALINREGVSEVFVSIQTLTATQRRRIIKKLEQWPLVVRILPKLSDIASGQVRISDLREVDIEDLLGREPIEPDAKLLKQDIAGKCVMITGAGGSIGSELVRQAVTQGATKVVLLELSEFALYRITKELEVKGRGGARPEIIEVLGSAGDEELLRRIFDVHAVDTIYHAAAYKHVPILEENIAAAIRNNILATFALARLAKEYEVGRVVLISSDKAVRPANVKGATNRIQEMILQAMAREGGGRGTVFASVRFGNVLNSSGSVVPLFREQIGKGGPVTVTHPEIYRYFMTIPEAAELVIQAGAMAREGEIFALNMGRLVKIDELARAMIHLSGLEVADESNPEGDIEIVYTGLRPGDKLKEEVLIEGKVTKTRHPRILHLDEVRSCTMAEIEAILNNLTQALARNDEKAILAILAKHVEGFSPRWPES